MFLWRPIQKWSKDCVWLHHRHWWFLKLHQHTFFLDRRKWTCTNCTTSTIEVRFAGLRWAIRGTASWRLSIISMSESFSAQDDVLLIQASATFIRLSDFSIEKLKNISNPFCFLMCRLILRMVEKDLAWTAEPILWESCMLVEVSDEKQKVMWTMKSTHGIFVPN